MTQLKKGAIQLSLLGKNEDAIEQKDFKLFFLQKKTQ